MRCKRKEWEAALPDEMLQVSEAFIGNWMQAGYWAVYDDGLDSRRDTVPEALDGLIKRLEKDAEEYKQEAEVAAARVAWLKKNRDRVIAEWEAEEDA